MADTPAGFNAKLSRAMEAFASPEVLRKVGRAGAADATSVIRSAIGDTSMSHFTRRNPVDLTVKSWVTSDHEITFGPDRKAIGPSSILNSGHKAYSKGDRRLTGKFSKKTGKALGRTVKHSTGAHGGKGTADEGNRLIALRTAGRIHDEWLKTLRREFGG